VDSEGKKVVRQEVDAPCPLCGHSPMVLRRSRFGTFLGCGSYPACKGILPCDKDGRPLKLVKEQDIRQNCAECNAPMAVRWKGRRAFLACTRYPECKTTASLPEGVRLEPPPKVPPKPAGLDCPRCGKPLVIRTSRRGEFAACSGFPRCRNAMSLEKLEELKAAESPKNAK
jgi:DNA topoisomerase-1